MDKHLYLDMSDLVCIKDDDRGQQWVPRSMLEPDPPVSVAWWPEGEPGARVTLNSGPATI